MALPSATGFPTPQLFSAANPDDMYGATPDELRTMRDLGLPTGTPSLTGTADPTSSDQHTLSLDVASSLTGGAVGPANDPLSWSPDEAADQSNTALAKIATVNPDLAAQLQAQRTGQEDTGGGFWDTIKSGIASVAGLPVIKQALDWMSRPAQIIPELLDDREGDSWWEDIGQALSGNSEANWHRVLTDKFGIDGPLGAVLGFVGDIATDPLTYVTAGLGGLGRATATKTVGKIAFKSGEEIAGVAERIALAAGRSTDDVLESMVQDVTRIVGPDASGGVLGVALRDGDQAIIQRAADTMDASMKHFAGGGTFNNMSEELAAHLGINPGEVQGALDATRKAGTFGSREAYDAARAAAGATGGVRFKFSLPVFNMRYVSPAIPGSAALTTQYGFQVGRRFFSGLSGTTRMGKLVSQEFPNAAAAFDVFTRPGIEGGFQAMKKQFPEVASKLSRGQFGLGGMMYSASDTVGRLTAHFAGNSAITRGGGLGAQLVNDTRLAVMDSKNKFTHDSWSVVDTDGVWGDAGKRYRPEEIQRKLGANLKSDAESQARYVNFRETGVREGMSDAEVKTIEQLVKIEAQADYHAIRNGVNGVTTEVDFDSAEAVIPEQAAAYRGPGAHKLVAEEEDWHVLGGTAEGADNAHTGVSSVTTYGDDGDARGIILAPGKGTGTTSAPRVKNTLVVDESTVDNAATPGDVHRAYGKQADEWDNALGAKAATIDDPLDIAQARVRENRALKISAQAKKDGYDSILFRDKDGVKRLVVLDQTNVKRVTSDAATIARTKTAPRVLSKRVKDSLRGQLNADELNYSGGLSVFEKKLEKATANMTRDEATEHLRKMLGDRGINVGEGALFENDIMAMTAGYVDNLGTQAGNALLGRMQRKLEHMGFGGQYDLGGHSGPGYRFAPPDAAVDSLQGDIKRIRRKVAAATATHESAVTRQLDAERLSQEIARQQDTFDSLIEDLEAGFQHTAGGKAPRKLAGKGVRLGANPPTSARVQDLVDAADFDAAAQPRGAVDYPALRADIQANGVKEPIIVNVDPDSGRMLVIEGNHRLAIARELGLEEIPIRIRKGTVPKAFVRGADAPDAFVAGLPVDPDFIYQATTEEGFDRAAQEGLQTAPSPIMRGAPDQRRIDYEERLYGVGDPKNIRKENDVLLRWRRGRAPLHGTKLDKSKPINQIAEADEVFQHEGVSVGELEYLDKDNVWQPLKDRSVRQRIDELQGTEGKRLAAERKARISELKAADTKLHREQLHVQDALGEQNKIMAQMHTRVAQVQPALLTKPGDRAGFAAVKIPGFGEHYMPAYMAVEMNQAAMGFKQLGDFRREWRRFTGLWKTWATWMYPGFHMRNIQGAWFNNMLGGVTIKDHVFATRVRRAAHDMATKAESEWKWATREIGDGEIAKMGLQRWEQRLGRKATYADIAEMTSDAGINSTNSQAFTEAISGVDDLQRRMNKRRWIEKGPGAERGLHPGRRYTQAMQATGDLTENVFRTAAWIRGMKTTGGDVMGARSFTMLRHGDYADLTDWESGFVRDLVPFYKWMRTNTPYQIHQLLENPGKLAAVLHAKEAVYGAQGIDFEQAMQDMPPWMRDSLSIPLPGGRDGAFNAITLDLPMSDLYKGGGEYLSSFLPLIKPFVESYVIEKSLFSGAPLTEKAKAAIPFSNNIIGGLLEAVGIGTRNQEGQLMLDEKTANVVGVIPLFSRFRDWIFEDPDRAKYRANTAASAFFGFGIRPIDKETITNNELGFYYQNILPEMERMKSLGYALPTKDDLQEAGVIADTVSEGTLPGFDAPGALDQLTI